ncbi:MAG: hypothetical protein HY683_04655 [Chloroflexi bacterium]|nr:hypothetical protein [Chloroflexota bacterium]
MEQIRPGQTATERSLPQNQGLAYTPYQARCLARLEHFLRVQKGYERDQSREVWLLKAVQRAVYSAFMDCVAAGVHQEAKLLVEGATLSTSSA